MRILITAGPTREPIDAVRFISNRSSGRVGVELAHRAGDAGHDVTLLIGPVSLDCGHLNAKVCAFESTADLEKLLAEHFPHCDILIMAAAVADYRPSSATSGKINRSRDGGKLVIELEATPDLVAQAAATKKPGQKIMAFALEEPAHLEQRAAEKMRRKGVDAIVANPLDTMESATIRPILLTAAGDRVEPGQMPKRDFAAWLLDRATELV